MRQLITSFLILLMGPLLAQDYIPFLQPDNRWQVAVELDQTIWGPDAMYEYYLIGDTLVNDTLYTKMYLHYFGFTGGETSPPDFGFPLEPGPSSLAALLRESLEERKVYARLFDNNSTTELAEEVLLYDFSLNEGDTVYDEVVGASPHEITSLTEETHFGGLRRTWQISSEGTYYMEGVGSNLGPLEGITALVSGGTTELTNFCQSSAMDCGVQVDGLVNTRRQWNVLVNVYPFIDPVFTSITSEYRLGDTIQRLGHVYFAVGAGEDASDNPLYSYALDSPVYVREDAGKVYSLIHETREIVLYDFNLVPGDLFTYEGTNIWFILADIEEVQLLDGSTTRRFNFVLFEGFAFVEAISWLENIGSEYAPFDPIQEHSLVIDAVTFDLQCFYKEYTEEATYLNDNYEDCNTYIVDVKEAAEQPLVALSPNPSNGLVRFDPLWNDHRWVFYDVLGQEQFNQWATNGQLNLSALKQGWYRYLVLNRDGSVVGQGRWVRG